MSSKELEAGISMANNHEVTDVYKDSALHSEAVDEATMRYTTGPPIEIDEATNKRLFWKLNRRILAIQLVTYFCQSLDKGTLNFASIMGIKKDANLVGQQVCTYRSQQFYTFTNIPRSISGLVQYCTLVSSAANGHRISSSRNYHSPRCFL
jgi:hypothetical protein